MQYTIILCLLTIFSAKCNQRSSRERQKMFDVFLLNAVNSGSIPDVHGDLKAVKLTFNSLVTPGRPMPGDADNPTMDPSTSISSRSRRKDAYYRDEVSSQQDDSHNNANNVNSGENGSGYVDDEDESPLNSPSSESIQSHDSSHNSRNSGRDATRNIFEIASRRYRSASREPRRRHRRRHVNQQRYLGSLSESLRNIPKQHWSCCTLGALAGDKGFLCNTQYYAPRVLDRNANRVHNRRLSGTFFDNGAPTPDGLDILQTFDNCVSRQSWARQFESCCRSSLRDYTQRRNRWTAFRNAVSID